MKRTSVLLVLVVVILAATASIVLAKPGRSMEFVCWTNPQGIEQTAYFLQTGSGIVHRFKEDGKHDIYKPVSKFSMPGEGDWSLWTARSHPPCQEPTPASIGQFLVPDTQYWHRYN